MTGSPTSPARKLEAAAAVHATLFLVGVSWAFGGNADWVRAPISMWGSLSVLITLAAALNRDVTGGPAAGTFKWMLPVLALNALVLASLLSPGLRDVSYGDSHYFIPLRVPWWRPSSARPDVALRALWLFDGIYFACLNVMLLVTKRSVIRGMLAVVVANALALSVFGTIQKLVGSTGIYFGSVRSPQDYFFASFVYDNHWASFILLMLGACAGMILRRVRDSQRGGFFRGPALFGVVAAFLMAVTIPMSGSRFCTLLMFLLLCAALVKGTPALYRVLRISDIPRPAANLILLAAAGAAAWGAWMIVGGFFSSRVLKAGDQIREMWSQGRIGTRSILYHDTWRMVPSRPLFGWGMGSYPTVFRLFNTQYATGDHIPVVYHDAHSDWLQGLAELGFVGTALIGLSVAYPAASLLGKRIGPLPLFLLLGCGLVAGYSLVEFPFGNVAVVLAWWLCFACAVQYTRLSAPLPGRPNPR